MRTVSKPHDCFVDPNRLYTRAAFLQALGLGHATLREARRRHIDLPCLEVGRQLLVKGAVGIEWAERVAAMETERKAQEATP
ncbi:MAG: hypothetical protein K8T25_06710 [Planctomycetia bacterium]|nr:hypothetical protein [Planctomycetia bacterium]